MTDKKGAYFFLSQWLENCYPRGFEIVSFLKKGQFRGRKWWECKT